MVKNKVKYFSKNDVGRDFVVGDIHGCYDTFKGLLDKVDFNYKVDRMFSVGDLVDRGSRSMDCLELIYARWFRPVYANHEDMMLNTIINNNFEGKQNWVMNGGGWYMGVDSHELKTFCQDYIERVPYINVVDTPHGRVNIVHAEIFKYGEELTDDDIDEWTFDSYSENNLLWGRSIQNFKYNLSKSKIVPKLSTTYCGHTPVKSIEKVYGHIFIDTGAVFSGGKLTAVDITNNLVYTYDNKTFTRNLL